MKNRQRRALLSVKRRMSNEEQRARWDLKYEQGLPSLTEPDPFFIFAYETFVKPSFPNGGEALDLAGGLGRHALWLASRNWRVTVVDVSDVAIERLRQTATELSVHRNLTLLIGDAADHDFALAKVDLIVLFYHFDRSLFPKIISTLRPGGLLLSKMSLRWETADTPVRGGAEPLRRDELPSLVPQLQVLHHLERPVRNRGVAEFVGRK